MRGRLQGAEHRQHGAAQSHGVFAQRFHLNIDFDSKRDYAADKIVSVELPGTRGRKAASGSTSAPCSGCRRRRASSRRPFRRTTSASAPTPSSGRSRCRAILATQKGSVVGSKTFTIGNGVVAPQDITKRDLDYEARRFFWVVDPRTLPGYPAARHPQRGAASSSPPTRSRPMCGSIGTSPPTRTPGANANYDGITAVGANGSERDAARCAGGCSSATSTTGSIRRDSGSC